MSNNNPNPIIFSRLRRRFVKISQACWRRLNFWPYFLAVEPVPLSAPPKSITTVGDAEAALRNIASFMFTVFIILVVIFALFAAFLYLLASGSEDRLKQAKTVLIYVIVAVVIALIAASLPDLIGNIIGVR